MISILILNVFQRFSVQAVERDFKLARSIYGIDYHRLNHIGEVLIPFFKAFSFDHGRFRSNSICTYTQFLSFDIIAVSIFYKYNITIRHERDQNRQNWRSAKVRQSRFIVTIRPNLGFRIVPRAVQKCGKIATFHVHGGKDSIFIGR